MRVLLLADLSSSHVVKWARALSASGLKIGIFGLASYDGSAYDSCPDVAVTTVDSLHSGMDVRHCSDWAKLKYLGAWPRLRQMIKTFAPDILHAHYATSYGLLGAVAGFHPYIVSVWGSDVFDFPHVSPLHQAMVKFNLHRADKILSTSQVMARETKQYTPKDITVTPFGIDTDQFRPFEAEGPFQPGDIVIGTVKTLEAKYGIDYLIRAFALLRQHHPSLPLKLLIVGGGSQEGELQSLAAGLEIEREVVFTGRVNMDAIPRFHNMISIFVSVSVLDSESFGVAVLEACACAKPVVVSDRGGLPEVVRDGVTGLVVPARDPERTAAALETLVLNEELRREMGTRGRERVTACYNWRDNVRQMIAIYQGVLGAAAGAPEAKKITRP